MSFLGGDAVVGEVDGDLIACLPASGGGAGAGGGDGLSRFDVFSCVSGLLAEGDEECGGIGGAAVGGCGGVGMDGCYEFIPGTGGRQYEGEAQGCQCEGECGGYEFLFHCYATPSIILFFLRLYVVVTTDARIIKPITASDQSELIPR